MSKDRKRARERETISKSGKKKRKESWGLPRAVVGVSKISTTIRNEATNEVINHQSVFSSSTTRTRKNFCVFFVFSLSMPQKLPPLFFATLGCSQWGYVLWITNWWLANCCSALRKIRSAMRVSKLSHCWTHKCHMLDFICLTEWPSSWVVLCVFLRFFYLNNVEKFGSRKYFIRNVIFSHKIEIDTKKKETESLVRHFLIAFSCCSEW